MERATPAGKPCRALKVRTSTENWGASAPPFSRPGCREGRHAPPFASASGLYELGRAKTPHEFMLSRLKPADLRTGGARAGDATLVRLRWGRTPDLDKVSIAHG